MEFEGFEMIRGSCAQIPDPRQHMVVYFAWYSHRSSSTAIEFVHPLPEFHVPVQYQVQVACAFGAAVDT